MLAAAAIIIGKLLMLTGLIIHPYAPYIINREIKMRALLFARDASTSVLNNPYVLCGVGCLRL